MSKASPKKHRKNRRRNRQGGNLRDAIFAYMKKHPTAQYFEMIEALHSRRVRINRHGSGLIMAYYQIARKRFS